MKEYLWAAVLILLSLTPSSCNPAPLDFTDNSSLKGITLSISNESQRWEFGEERTFTIVPGPNTTICERFDLKVSNPDIVLVAQGNLPNQFKLTAEGVGKLIVTASAIGHDESGAVELTRSEEFQLEDTRVKPTRPIVRMQISPNTDLTAKRPLAEDKAFVTDDAKEYIVTASSDDDRATFSLKSSDPHTISVERCGTEAWLVKTNSPGRCWLHLAVTDRFGNPFQYDYLIYAFGHLTMTAEYDPLVAEAGFSINEHAYSPLSAQVYLAGQVFGWPWNDPDNVIARDIPVFNGTMNIADTFSFPNLCNTKDAQDSICETTTDAGRDKAWFNIHRAKLNHVFTLSNPYIVIDALIDDSDREETLHWDFYIEGVFQQNGLAKVESPETVKQEEDAADESGMQISEKDIPL